MKMKYFIASLWAFFLLTISFQATAQGTIKGIITAVDQPEGLISATVLVGDAGTVTEYDGSYELSLPAGEHTVEISYTGYDTYKETFSLADGETREINAELKFMENLLQTATVTSGKYEKPLGEVTVSLEVIKPSFAEATNSTSVDQVLDRVPGVTIVDGQANIRGGSGFSYGAGSRVLLLVDDVPILSGDAGFPSWGDVPVENISQVEVVKGAASALYGSSALNGIINIRTAYAKSKPETQIAVFRDMYTSPKDEIKKWWAPDSISAPHKTGFSVIHRRKIDKLDMVLGLNGYKEKDYIQNARDEKIRGNVKLRYRFTENLNAGVFVNANFGKSNTVFLWDNSPEGGYVGTQRTNTDVRRYNIDPFVNFTDKFGSRHRYIGRYYSTNNDNDNNQGNFSDNFYNEYQFQKKFDKPGIILTTGLVNTYAISSGTLYGDTQFKSNNIAAYVQAEKKFYFNENEDGSPNEKKNVLNLTLGARYESNSLQGPDTVYYSPTRPLFELLEGKIKESKPVFRVGMSYQASEYTYLRASWGQGYRFPSIAEKYIYTRVLLEILPNPLLTSETGWSSEIGLKQGFRAGPIEGFIDVSAFWSEYSNMMEFNLTSIPVPNSNNPINGFQSQNVGSTVIQGSEISIAGRTNSNAKVPITFLLGYTYLNPKFKEFVATDYDPSFANLENLTEGERNGFFSTSDENILKYRNKHSFKSDVEATFAKKYSLGLSLNGATKMAAIDQAFLIIIGGEDKWNSVNKSYAIFDARVGWEPIEGYKLTLVGKNLFNTEYASRPGLLQPMRSFSVRLDAKF